MKSSDGDEWVLSCDLRLAPPSVEGQQKWELFSLDTRRRWRVQPAVIRVLVAGATEAGESAILDWARRVGVLRPRREDEPRLVAYRAWQRDGWSASSELQVLLKNYPAVQYDAPGHVKEREAVATQRLGALGGDAQEVVPDWAREAFRSAEVGVSEAFVPATPKGAVNRGDIVTTAAAGVGLTDDVDRPVGGTRVGSRPSFGGLWNINAYVIALQADDLEEGLYAVDVTEPEPLRRVGGPLSRDEVDTLLVGPVRAAFDVRAVVIFSIEWGRLRARYLDPSAFRCAFIELGHAAAASDLMAKALGLMSYPQGGADDVRLAEYLRLTEDPTEEAIIYSVTLGVERSTP